VVFAMLFNQLGGELLGWGWLAIPAALLTGGLIGLANGLVHVKLKIPSFMASLAVGFVGTGLSVLLTGGDIVRVNDEVFRALLLERLFGFPLMVYVALIVVLLAWFIQRKTTIGRNFYAVGGGEDLAHASGLNVVIGLPRYVQDGVLGVLVIIAVVLSTNRRSLALVK